MWKRGQLEKVGQTYKLPKEKVADQKSERDESATLFPDSKHDREAGRGGGT